MKALIIALAFVLAALATLGAAAAPPATKPAPAATQPSSPPPVGTTEAQLKTKFNATYFNKNKDNGATYYRLPNGATVTTIKGKVEGCFWEPFIGMKEADLLAFNYDANGTRYHIDRSDEREGFKVYNQSHGITQVLVKDDGATVSAIHRLTLR